MATFDVLLPVKNGIDYLAEAIDSIRTQTFRDWRLLVLDHGSTDGSFELAQAYAEEDIRVEPHRLPDAIGLAGLLNQGLDLCDCRYVLRQDADDISLPQRMARLEQAYRADAGLAFIGSLGDVIDAHGRRIGALDMPTTPESIAAAALFRTPVSHPAASMRLGTLHDLNIRYGEDFIKVLPESRRLHVPGLAEDYFLFGQLALIAPCRNLDEKLIQYRWHGANISATRYLEQMRVALNISRHLADSLAAINDCASADPAPFCTHGEALFEIAGRHDFSVEFAQMSRLLHAALPDGEALQRELAFRHSIAVRSAPVMAARFLRFSLRHGTTKTERRAIKSWLLRGVRRQPMLTLPSLAQTI